MDFENDVKQNEEVKTNTAVGESSGGTAIKTESFEEISQITDEARMLAEKTAELEMQQEAQREQDQRLLDALDDVLEKRAAQANVQRKKPHPKFKNSSFAVATVKRGVGFLSLGLILVFMGIVALISLFSPAPDYLMVIKLSPVCAVLIGLEILINLAVSRSKIRINIPCVSASALLVIGCCVMSVVFNESYNVQKEIYNNRSVAAEIYKQSYEKLKSIVDIEAVDITVDLNPDGTGKYKGTDALSEDDYVYVVVRFAGTHDSTKSFAVDCKKIIEVYRDMGINIRTFNFIDDSEFSSLRLEITGKYAQDFSVDRLAEKVNYIYIESNGFAFEDLKDNNEE